MEAEVWALLLAAGLEDFYVSNLTRAHGWWSDFLFVVGRIRSTVEPFAWVVGSVLALVPGTFAIYKWLYYRKSRLPYRFEEMLKEREKRLNEVRHALLDNIQYPTPIKPIKSPLFFVPSLSKAIKRLGWSAPWKRAKSRLPDAETHLSSAMDEIEQQLRYWEDHYSGYKKQQATIFLLQGAILAAQGGESEGDEKRKHNKDALACFTDALEIGGSDLEALEYVAHQNKVLEHFEEAIERYQELEKSANKLTPDHAMIRMRALRSLGEIYEIVYDRDGKDVDLKGARNFLDRAVKKHPRQSEGRTGRGVRLRDACERRIEAAAKNTT